ncbi:MAG TPA: zf-HC2 domain-containing protein [Chthonomonadaceae bacterium]|nr:zf-HC2 domain-containing protein [Chthonomonadaceae bacterium]
MLNRSRLHHRVDPQNADNVVLPGFASGSFAIVPPPGLADGGSGEDNPCDLVMANLAAYVDNELNGDERRVVETHVAKCAECAAGLDALRTTDAMLQREWRECVPLPSSLQFKRSVDSIMAALPPAPAAPAAFARKRVHSRLRWIRFSTGLAGLFAFISLLWSSYRLGYAHGRMSLSSSPQSTASPVVTPASRHSSVLKLTPIRFTPAPPSLPPPNTTPPQTFARSLR